MCYMTKEQKWIIPKTMLGFKLSQDFYRMRKMPHLYKYDNSHSSHRHTKMQCHCITSILRKGMMVMFLSYAN